VGHFPKLSEPYEYSASKCGVIFALCVHKFEKKNWRFIVYCISTNYEVVNTYKLVFYRYFRGDWGKNYLLFGIIGVSIDDTANQLPETIRSYTALTVTNTTFKKWEEIRNLDVPK